jgi:hypothetical protein
LQRRKILFEFLFAAPSVAVSVARPTGARVILITQRSAERRKICATQKKSKFFREKIFKAKPLFFDQAEIL